MRRGVERDAAALRCVSEVREKEAPKPPVNKCESCCANDESLVSFSLPVCLAALRSLLQSLAFVSSSPALPGIMGMSSPT